MRSFISGLLRKKKRREGWKVERKVRENKERMGSWKEELKDMRGGSS